MPSVAEVSSRIRAARGYSGLTQGELADKLGLSVETMSRTENGRRTAQPDEIERIAALCGVPMEFMRTGWQLIVERGRVPAQSDVIERLDRLEELVTQRLGASGSPQPGGELGRELSSEPPIAGDRRRRERRRAEGSPPGSGE